MTNWTYNPDRSLASKLKRRLTQYRKAAPANLSKGKFVVSFTFDDFPKSAVTGADIIETHGGKAGFFACTSMMGQTGPYGEMFDAETMLDLHSRGHEIGSHTHSHIDCNLTNTGEVLSDIDRNLEILKELGLPTCPTSFAFPFGETAFDTKKAVREKFEICRGVLPGTNVGTVDIAQLRCWELDSNPLKIERAEKAILDAASEGGWVIIFTHDVAADHTDYGACPTTIAKLCKQAIDSGADILPPTEAARSVGLIE